MMKAWSPGKAVGGGLLVLFGLALHAPPCAAQSCTQPDFDTSSLAGVSAKLVLLADLDRDGTPDLVAIGAGGEVVTLLGRGDGTFEASVSAGTTSSPDALTLGDFNGDGYPDVVVTSGSSVYVLLGNGTGLAPSAPPSPYTVASTVRSVAVGDVDRDGNADIVLAQDSRVAVLKGRGDGTFDPVANLLVVGATVVRLADLNGDGILDLALLQSPNVGVSLGIGDGTFGSVTAVSFGADSMDLAVGDLDRDTDADLVVVIAAPGMKLASRLGNGDGTFGSANDSNIATNNPLNLVLGNFDGDANLDAVITLQGSFNVEALQGLGDGRFSSLWTTFLTGDAPTGLSNAADLNDDGLDDVVVAVGGTVYVSVNTTGAECARYLSATSTGTAATGQNLLQWVNPAGSYAGIRIAFTTGAGCTPPLLPSDGTAITPDPPFAGPGARQGYPHGSLALDTPYCYSVFVKTGATTFSGRRELTARPFDTVSGLAKWGFSTGQGSSLAPPGNGIGVVHAVANSSVLHAMKKGDGGGTWPDGPPAWTPRSFAGPSQGRPSTIGVPVGPTATQVLFLGSQDGQVYAVDAQRGQLAWTSPVLGTMVQAAPSGMFRAFGGAHDYILVGTRAAGVPNAFYALHLADGTLAWKFTGDGNKIGIVSGQATVDYATRRVFFASFAFGAAAPDDHTVWCVDLDTGSRVWSVAIGNVTGSPILRGGRVYVGSYGTVPGGRIHALRAADGLPAWSSPYDTGFDTGFDGPVKGFVGADRLSPTGRLLFATTSKLWALDDPPAGTAPSVVWVRDSSAEAPADQIPNPSSPAYLAGGPYVFVGSANGKVYRLDYATGSPLTQVAIPLGDLAPVGSPTLDIREGFLYVGAASGVVYAVRLP